MKKQALFVACGDYGGALSRAFDSLFSRSGLGKDTRFAGKRVLLKPNLLSDRLPEEAVTTHPAFLREVIRRFRRLGADVSVGDSPASTANLQRVWERTGVQAVCRGEGVPLVVFERRGRAVERDGFSFSLSECVLETDWIVNLPKVKSHALTALTASVKNLYGAVPGYAKTALHKRYPKPERFGALLRAIWSTLPPSVTLVDGVVGMEGQGPANGRPCNLGFLGYSEDPFAMDLALCSVLKINPKQVPYLAGCGLDASDVECLGDIPSVDSFEIPTGSHMLRLLPAWLVALAGNLVWVRPVFDPGLCRRCGRCVAACPVKALRIGEGRVPRLDTALCVGCACCHEMCPYAAIRMAQAPLLRMLKVFKGLST